MIQPVETPSPSEATQQASSAAVPAGAGSAVAGKTFSDLHSAALSRRAKAEDTTGQSPASARIDAPEGETWAATKPGAHYARITAGPRTGQYINLTHGDRRGQTFTIENRDGKVMHVYGEGETKVEVSSKTDAEDITDAAKRAHGRPEDQPGRGERWAPVEGHSNYADILEGPRNGLYVNISGGIRDGMAFQIVKKGEKVFHVYGTGKDRQLIQVAPKDKKAETATDASDSAGTAVDETPESTAPAGTGSTGGTPAN